MSTLLNYDYEREDVDKDYSLSWRDLEETTICTREDAVNVLLDQLVFGSSAKLNLDMIARSLTFLAKDIKHPEAYEIDEDDICIEGRAHVNSMLWNQQKRHEENIKTVQRHALKLQNQLCGTDTLDKKDLISSLDNILWISNQSPSGLSPNKITIKRA